VVRGSGSHLGGILQAALAVLVGVALIAAPTWLRLTQDLSDERLMRIRAQERAEVAAHVHDSVLHTLTLIQRSAEDSREVARLARAQETRAARLALPARRHRPRRRTTTLAEGGTFVVAAGAFGPVEPGASSRSWARASRATSRESSALRWIRVSVCSTESWTCAATSARSWARIRISRSSDRSCVNRTR